MFRLARISLLLVLVASAATGCATFKRMRSDSDDVAAKAAKRTAETVKAFEMQRNFAQFQAAEARWREGNVKACHEALEGLLQRDPKHLEAKLLLTQVLLSEEKFDQARASLEPILAERPADARVQHTMGLLMEMQGKSEEALACYQRAAELEPENEEYALACRPVPAAPADASAVQSAGYRAPAENAAADGQDRAPEVQPAPAAKGRPDVELALADAERALEAEQMPKARDLLTKAVSLDPNSAQLAVRAAVLPLRHQHPELAIFVLQPLADRFSESAPFKRTLGMAYYRQGNYQAAQRALEQALSLDNSSALAYLLLGCTLEKLGQADAAKSRFEQAHRLEPRLRLQP